MWCSSRVARRPGDAQRHPRPVPNARVGFIGLKRHEQTLKAAVYHKSLPENLSNTFEVILIGPMLATGELRRCAEPPS